MSVAVHASSDQVQREIQALVAGDGSRDVAIGADRIHAFHALARFYERRDYRAAWPRDLSEALLGEIQHVDREGLNPRGYHLSLITDRIAQNAGSPGSGARQAAELDILLTDAFLLLGSHLLSGRTNPVTIDAEWFADRREGDMVPVLEDALVHGTVSRSLEALKPADAAYAHLRSYLARLRAVAAQGGWPRVGPGETVKPGDVDPRIPEVRRRLAYDAPGPVLAADSTIYDPDLAEAVRRFQERHGLNPDGVIGPRTLAALNVPVETRIDCVLANLERWRWLPRDLGSRYILVNIAGFALTVVEDHHPVLTMKVVVGRTYRRTPVFTGNLSRIVFSPAWDVPRKLAVQDKLPLIRKNPEYFEKEGIQVFVESEGSLREVDPRSVDWSQVTARGFPYRLRQKPGPRNALGGVKFLFPNPFSVYLHDTSQPELFGEVDRAFSSGCIRLERPADLAAYLLRGRPDWNPETIAAAMKSGRERTVTLETPVPVHILYWTAWEDAEGRLQFRPDIYDRDRPLLAALREDPPGSGRGP